MNQNLKFEGIYPPVTTPFINDELDLEGFKANLKKYAAAGVAGVVVLGSNGEYVYLSEEEKINLVKTAAEVMPEGLKVIAGSGCESTRETIRLTNVCADAGAHAALIVTPSYYGGKMDNRALLNHYFTVADNSKIPILLYNVTKFTNINMPPKLVAELAKHPNIVGIKDSNGNMAQMGELLELVDKDFSVLVGTAGALYPALTIGAVGGVLALANIAPYECVEILNLTKAGKHEEASKLYRKMIPLNKAVTATYGIAGLKAAMDMLGYVGGKTRSPLMPLTQDQLTELEKIIKGAGIRTE
ncbi:MAG: 4-hydroxy-2-oxoglutarate aldolase [Thermosediminibacterales bacterium]|nr:4-hydroxy-2-oxoglutarate aldolase [Thermosediminibacterales bacterium]MDK2835941.1 4-hydroxy-2-oxoglutarate aldolase [Thermosediminibacterales bacterium]